MITEERFRLLEQIAAKQAELIEVYRGQADTLKQMVARLENTVEVLTRQVTELNKRTAMLKRMRSSRN